MLLTPSGSKIAFAFRQCKCTLKWRNFATDLPHRSHDGEFLRVDEALEHDADSHVDVILIYIISQVKSRVRFGHANHRLDVTHGDRDASGSLSRDLFNFIYKC